MKEKFNSDVDDENLCKKNSKMKWIILLLASLALLGDYYCFDNPGALQSLLFQKFKKEGENFEYLFNLLYSVYSLPNTVLPMIGGVLIFKFGYRCMFLVFGICLLIGQLIFAIGCSTNSIVIMLIGRGIFGLGGESLNTTQFSIIIQWFGTNQIGLAMGLCLSVARLGNVLNDVISPRIATTSDVCSALWLGFAVCSFSFICTILLVYLDWRQDILIQMREIVTSNNAIILNDNKENSFKALKNLPRIFYFLSFYCLLIYGGTLPFNYIATAFLIKSWYNNKVTAEIQHNVGIAMAIPFFISIFLVPFIGVATDKFGKRGYFLIFSAFFGVTTYILFLFISPIIPLISLGVTYSIFASIVWPSLTLVIPKDIIGIGLGLATSMQNLGLVILPIIIASLYTSTQSYDNVLFFFIFINTLALIFAFFTHFEDYKHNRILHCVHLGDATTKEKTKFTLIYKYSKKSKEPLSIEIEKNEEETKLLQIKELF